MITENLTTLKIQKLSQAQYDREVATGNADSMSLYLTPDDTADYVVEQGNVREWTYIKWNSGRLEGWYANAATDSCTEEYGGLYITPEGEVVVYPFVLVDAAKIFLSTVGVSGGGKCFGLSGVNNLTTQTPPLYFVSNVYGDTNINYNLYVVGRWK